MEPGFFVKAFVLGYWDNGVCKGKLCLHDVHNSPFNVSCVVPFSIYVVCLTWAYTLYQVNIQFCLICGLDSGKKMVLNFKVML